MVEQTAMADPTERTLTFGDMYVLATGGVEVFVYDMADEPDPPPYFINVAGRRFAYTGDTYLQDGHGAVLPEWVRQEEEAGRLVMFVLRHERLLAYLHDPAAPAAEDDEAAAEE